MSERQESSEPMASPAATPLAWAYACTRMEARKAFDRYQRARGEALSIQAREDFRAAHRAGGLERRTVSRIANLLRVRRDFNDPSAVFICLGDWVRPA